MEEEHAKKGAFEDSSVDCLSLLNGLHQEETATVNSCSQKEENEVHHDNETSCSRVKN